jgi:hypothetical protein
MNNDITLSGVEIQKIYRNYERKDGTKYIDKNGKNYSRTNIFVDPSTINDEDFEGWLNMIDYGESSDWGEHSKIDVVVTKKVLENGKVFFNIRPPNKVDSLETRVEALEKRVSALEGEPEEKTRPVDYVPTIDDVLSR